MLMPLWMASCGVWLHWPCRCWAHSLMLLSGGGGSSITSTGIWTRSGGCFWRVATLVHHISCGIIFLFYYSVSTCTCTNFDEGNRMRSKIQT